MILAFALLVLVVAPGLLALRRPRLPRGRTRPWEGAASLLRLLLAFLLVFLAQEVALVLAEALVPGLDPVLFHNDHDWTGSDPRAELLQGTGALGTLLAGAIAALWLGRARHAGSDARLLAAWIAYLGASMALMQLVLAAIFPGNDVARALRALGVGEVAVSLLALAAPPAVAVVARWVGRRMPAVGGWRGLVLLPALVTPLLLVPFRAPAGPAELLLFPAVVIWSGVGWLRPGGTAGGSLRVTLLAPLIALVLLLILFQLVLRPGISVSLALFPLVPHA